MKSLTKWKKKRFSINHTLGVERSSSCNSRSALVFCVYVYTWLIAAVSDFVIFIFNHVDQTFERKNKTGAFCWFNLFVLFIKNGNDNVYVWWRRGQRSKCKLKMIGFDDLALALSVVFGLCNWRRGKWTLEESSYECLVTCNNSRAIQRSRRCAPMKGCDLVASHMWRVPKTGYVYIALRGYRCYIFEVSDSCLRDDWVSCVLLGGWAFKINELFTFERFHLRISLSRHLFLVNCNSSFRNFTFNQKQKNFLNEKQN